MQEPVRLLWTGGWDSTFRLLQLLLVEQRDVQPIYVIDHSRAGRWLEMESMDGIQEALAARIPSGVTLYPRQLFVRHDFPDIPELKARYDALKERTRVGSQYYWLAVIAEQRGLQGAELCMPKHEMPSGLQEAVFENVDSDYPKVRDTWEAQLFAYWTFPSITWTKLDMRAFSIRNEFMDILRMRWFCFTPVNGKACGECRPCRIAQEDGVVDGIEFASSRELNIRKFSRKFRGKIRKVFRR